MKKVWNRGGVNSWDVVFCITMALKETGHLENWPWLLIIALWIGMSLLEGYALEKVWKKENKE